MSGAARSSQAAGRSFRVIKSLNIVVLNWKHLAKLCAYFHIPVPVYLALSGGFVPTQFDSPLV